MGEYENINITDLYRDIQYIKDKVDHIEKLYEEQEFEKLLRFAAWEHEEKKVKEKISFRSEKELWKALSE